MLLRRACMQRTQRTTSCLRGAGEHRCRWVVPLAEAAAVLHAVLSSSGGCAGFRVLRWRVPAGAVFFEDGPLRVDSGVQQGDLVRGRS